MEDRQVEQGTGIFSLCCCSSNGTSPISSQDHSNSRAADSLEFLVPSLGAVLSTYAVAIVCHCSDHAHDRSLASAACAIFRPHTCRFCQ